ncbi:hypothetical protein CHARACLAT_029799 [Characodon lateralis]|uniref:Uncharacterized protein n=1 Tax=Characodon lateralis TaxID=208331 RepID=A0ABU7ENP0_9TELE|nr:hypothetical protein [Characodon lateralis]
MNTEKTYNSDFYKDGFHLGTYYETDMTLYKVSKSDEGLYKCSISGAGESPESWLAVVKPIEEEGSNEKMQPLTHLALILIILLCTIFTLLFLVIGVILYKKHKALKNEIVTHPKYTTYAFVNKPRKRNAGGDTANEPDDVTYAAVQIKKKGSKVSKPTIEQHASEQESTYSLIALKKGNNTLESDWPPLLASSTRAVNQFV